jgi:four helix bundle protein
MGPPTSAPNGKPFDIRERLLEFACDVVKTSQFLHTQGSIGRALSYQLIAAGTSAGANAHEAESASSHDDFFAKNRIALREAKETRFRLLVCRRCGYLDARFDPLLAESDELVRILGKIVHTAVRRRQARRAAEAAAKRSSRAR